MSRAIPPELMLMVFQELDLEDLVTFIEAIPQVGYVVSPQEIRRKQDETGANLLHAAAKAGAYGMLNILGKDKIREAHAPDNYGQWPLHFAIREGHLETTQFLLQAGCDASACDTKRRFLIHAAIYRFDSKREILVKLLLAHGADPSSLSYGGTAPLHLCGLFDRTGSIAKMLIEAGADVDVRRYFRIILNRFTIAYAPSAKGVTPLYYAVSNSNIPVIRALLDGGADVSLKSGYEGMPIGGLIVCPGHLTFRSSEEVIYLLELIKSKGADLNVASEDNGTTVLMVAARHGNVEAVRWLLNEGVDIHRKEYYTGADALKLAVCGGHGVVANILIEAGADPRAQDYSEKDAYDYIRIPFGFHIAEYREVLRRELANILDGQGTKESMWDDMRYRCISCDDSVDFCPYTLDKVTELLDF